MFDPEKIIQWTKDLRDVPRNVLDLQPAGNCVGAMGCSEIVLLC